MNRVIKIVGNILIAIVLLLLFVVAGYNLYQHVFYADFFKTSEKEFIIPGLKDGFIPQGLTYDEESGLYLSSGYMSDGSGSRVYYVDPETNEYDYMNIMKHENGRYVYSFAEAGGITIYDDYIFICTDELISIFNKLDITKDKFGSNIETGMGDLVPIATFDPQATPEFIYAYDGKLYIGEFYTDDDDAASKIRQIETDDGEVYNAIMTVYDAEEIVSSISLGNISNISPLYCYSIVDDATGMCMLPDGKICISTSSGYWASHIKVYENPQSLNEEGDEIFTTDGEFDIQLYHLDAESLLEDYKLPPLAEELYAKDDRVLVMCNSASNKYILGKFTSSKYCYSFEPTY